MRRYSNSLPSAVVGAKMTKNIPYLSIVALYALGHPASAAQIKRYSGMASLIITGPALVRRRCFSGYDDAPERNHGLISAQIHELCTSGGQKHIIFRFTGTQT